MNQNKIADSVLTKTELIKQIDSLKIQNQIDKLKFQIDTQNSIVNEVNNFYDSAWLKLLFVITILGIILPIVIQYFQRKNYKELAVNLKNTFENKLESFRENNELKIDKIVKEYENKLKSLESKNDNAMLEIDANTFYLQGRALFIERHFQGSIFSYLKSAIFLKKCGRIDRILPILNNIRRALKVCDKDKITQLDDLIANKFENQNFKDVLDEIENDISLDSLILIRSTELKKIYSDKKTMPNSA